VLDQYEEHDARHPSLSSRVLTWLVLLLAGAGAALWGGPKLAPQLPEWAAPAAKYLTPGGDAASRDVTSTMDARISTIETQIEGVSAEMSALTASVQASLSEGGSISEETLAEITSKSAEVEGLRAQLGEMTGQIGTLTQRVEDAEAAAADRVAKAQADADAAQARMTEIAASTAYKEALDDLKLAAEEGVPYANQPRQASRLWRH